MKPLSRKLRLILLGVATLGLGLVTVVEFTGWQQLDAVTLNGNAIENPAEELGLDPEASVLEQPLREVAARLLADDQTARVDIDYSLPASLRIETNRFTPVCLVLDRPSGRLFGLNHQGRVVPLPRDYEDWEHPVVSGVGAGRIFDLCDDPRVTLLVPQLMRLADDNIELYRLIDEIDLRSKTCAAVTISGLPYRLKANADALYEQTTGFIRFLEKYATQPDSARVFDLRFTNMIIQESPRN